MINQICLLVNNKDYMNFNVIKIYLEKHLKIIIILKNQKLKFGKIKIQINK